MREAAEGMLSVRTKEMKHFNDFTFAQKCFIGVICLGKMQLIYSFTLHFHLANWQMLIQMRTIGVIKETEEQNT